MAHAVGVQTTIGRYTERALAEPVAHTRRAVELACKPLFGAALLGKPAVAPAREEQRDKRATNNYYSTSISRLPVCQAANVQPTGNTLTIPKPSWPVERATDSMNVQNPGIKQLTVAAFLRLWLVFSFVMVLGVLTWATFERESPLMSDDPHVVGSAFALVATGVAVIYSIAESFRRWARYKHWITATSLSAWCLILAIAESFTDGEGDGLLMFAAVGSLMAGLLAWFLCAVRLPTWVRVVISVAGVVSVLAYGYVVIRMSTMR